VRKKVARKYSQPFSIGGCYLEWVKMIMMMGMKKSLFSSSILLYVGNGTKYGNSYNGRRTGTRFTIYRIVPFSTTLNDLLTQISWHSIIRRRIYQTVQDKRHTSNTVLIRPHTRDTPHLRQLSFLLNQQLLTVTQLIFQYIQPKHWQIMKILSSEPTCFYINHILLT